MRNFARCKLCKMTPFINEQNIPHPGKIINYIYLHTKNIALRYNMRQGGDKCVRYLNTHCIATVLSILMYE